MKKLSLFLFMILLIAGGTEATAQFKGLDKKIEQKVKRRAERKVDTAIDKALDKTEKEAGDAVKGKKKSAKQTAREKEKGREGEDVTAAGGREDSFRAYTKFDFAPGERSLFYDDFSQDSPGDFPARWNTNGAGQVVTSSDENKLFELKGGAVYLPQIAEGLPENYTLEFDLSTSGLDEKLSSTVFMQLILDDNTDFKTGRSFARIRLPFCQYYPNEIQVESMMDGKEVINNRLVEDVRARVKAGTHISVAVNKKRFRLWMDEQKIVDIPTLVPASARVIKLGMQGFSEDFKNYHYYISNFKVAAGSSDLRSKLMTEGKFSTSGILFDTNSDHIKPESQAILKEIAEVLKDNETFRVKIIGHTDSDGDSDQNLALSRRRAAAVRAALAENYNIAENRMEIAGKGEGEPSDTNNSAEGKANNRRVEFVKM